MNRPLLLLLLGLALSWPSCPAVAADAPPLFRVARDGRLGFVSPAGRIVVPLRYEGAARAWTEGRLWVVGSVTQTFSGNFIDGQGRELLQHPAAQFADDVLRVPPDFWNGKAIVEIEPGVKASVDASGNVMRGVSRRDNTPMPHAVNGRVGFVDPAGREILPARFSDARPFDGDFAPAQSNGAWGLVDRKGEWTLPPEYEDIGPFGPRSAWVRRDGKWGLVDHSGKALSPFAYGSVLWLSPSRGLFKARRDGMEELLTDTGESPLSVPVPSIDRLTDRSIVFRTEDREGLYDADLRRVVPARHEKILCWEGLEGQGVAVRSGGKWGLVRPGGGDEFLLPFEHDLLQKWNGLIEARKGGQIALFDAAGKARLPWDAGATEIPNPLLGMVNGFGKLVCQGKAGLIDGEGAVRLPCLFEDVGIFSDGLVPARQDGKWGYVALDGAWAIEPRFDEARPFSEGLAAVRSGQLFGLIDAAGNTVVPFRFADAGLARQGRIPVALDEAGSRRWGLVDLAGDVTLPIEYDALEWIDSGSAPTRIHGTVSWVEY